MASGPRQIPGAAGASGLRTGAPVGAGGQYPSSGWTTLLGLLLVLVVSTHPQTEWGQANFSWSSPRQLSSGALKSQPCWAQSLILCQPGPRQPEEAHSSLRASDACPFHPGLTWTLPLPAWQPYSCFTLPRPSARGALHLASYLPHPQCRGALLPLCPNCPRADCVVPLPGAALSTWSFIPQIFIEHLLTRLQTLF